MNKTSTILLQGVIVVFGICILALILWFPNIEGRNVKSTLWQVYFNDPFLAYAYFASIAFFVGVYQVFKLVGYIGENKLISLNSVRVIQIVKYCAILLIGFIVAPLAYLFIARPEDDIAGGVAMGLFLILVSGVTALTSMMFEKKLQSKLKKIKAI